MGRIRRFGAAGMLTFCCTSGNVGNWVFGVVGVGADELSITIRICQGSLRVPLALRNTNTRVVLSFAFVCEEACDLGVAIS